MDKVFNRSLKLAGQDKKINGVSLRVLASDRDGKVLLATGTSVPTGAGYAKGCLFIKTDAATGTKGLYENQGTTAAASFDLMGNIASADIASGAVTLAKLAAGITPSHVVKYAGKFTTAGGDAAEQASVAGVVATDIVVASLQDNGTNNVTLVQSVPGTNVINFTMSADPGTDAIISYMVLRAAA